MTQLPKRPVQYLSLKELKLDGNNPRFGMERGNRANQTDILDYIVENFGIEDVLSSLAYNGYFDAEPLIAIKNEDGTFTIVEGNRRLSACLILASDERAKNQSNRAKQFDQDVLNKWHNDPKVPVHVFDNQDEIKNLNAYLGVRHITSAKAWDSYAKAAWIDRVVSSGEMTLEQICEVTGDKNRTIKRLLEGYYFVNQLIDEGRFNPKDSARKGRGSNPNFPFSWIYTLLDYSPVREHLNLEEFEAKNDRPIPQERIREASNVIRYMFGDRSAGINPSIRDSRQIGNLANALGDPIQREQLARGKSIEEIERLSKPVIDQFISAITSAKDEISLATSIANQRKIESADLPDALEEARAVANMASALFKTLRDMDEPEQF